MYWKCVLFLLLAVLVTASGGMAQPTNQPDGLKEFRKRAAAFKSVIALPQFETTTNAIRFNLRQTIAVGNAALDRIGAVQPREVTFENTVRALDDISYQISLTDDRFSLLKDTSTSAAFGRASQTRAMARTRIWTPLLSLSLPANRTVGSSVRPYPRRTSCTPAAGSQREAKAPVSTPL
jgi:hypothetical protein